MGRKSTLKRNYDNEGKLISKECSKCHKIKLPSEFSKNKKTIDGLGLICKECRKIYYQKNSDTIKEYNKKYRQENKEFIKEYEKKRYKENPDYFREKNKKYRQENPNYRKEYNDKKTQVALQQINTEIETNPEKYNYNGDKKPYGIIYLVHNIKTNRYYVGQTTIGFNNRYPSGWLYYHRNKELIKEDLELYGENSFEYKKIFDVAYSQHDLDILEAHYIDYYDSYENGYNGNRGNIFTNRGKEI